MECKEFLKEMLESNHDTVKRLIDDIGEEESMRHDYEFCNHIRWQTGHLIDSARIMLKLLGKEEDIPEEWSKIFGYKSKIYDNASLYPSMSILKEKLYFFYNQMITAIDKIESEDLHKIVELGDDWKVTPLEGINFLCRHEFYHCGQITVMRRAIGREKPFG